MNLLVVYYSLSGTARAVATALASELGADTEEIRCARYRPGFLGALKAAYDSWKGNLPELEPSARVPSRYDLVIVGGPVWAWNASTPVRAYLTRQATQLPSAAFFVTVGGVGFEQALRTMETLAGRQPVATLVVRANDVKEGKVSAAVASFAAALRQDKAA